MTSDLARRRSLLIAALAAVRAKESMPELQMMHRWLDNWTGLGHIVTGMERQGYALSLTKIADDGWRATFHSNPALSADGFATDDKPWRAVQRAAWDALNKEPAQPALHSEDGVA